MWIDATKIANWSPTENNRLCSEHFQETDFYLTNTQRQLLFQAVPSIFPAFPIYFQRSKTLSCKN
jgi:hypothetical protein